MVGLIQVLEWQLQEIIYANIKNYNLIKLIRLNEQKALELSFDFYSFNMDCMTHIEFTLVELFVNIYRTTRSK